MKHESPVRYTHALDSLNSQALAFERRGVDAFVEDGGFYSATTLALEEAARQGEQLRVALPVARLMEELWEQSGSDAAVIRGGKAV